MITDAQVRRLMEELSKHGKLEQAALRAGMHRNTAREYRSSGKLPSQMRPTRSWRTREDPLEEDWEALAEMLEAAPELKARTLMDFLLETKPDRYHEGHLRTLQRRVRQWRAQNGPEKEVYFAQEHRPGEQMQTDFTWMTKLQITIQGEFFDHMLCHVVLPYSNWEWATVCRSESLVALRRGVQDAVFQLGRIAKVHKTDNTSAATHDVPGRKRKFNEEYLALMRHLGMKARTIQVGKSNQNGDVEALHNVLKRRVNQHLLLRGSRDFESVASYETWLRGVVTRANALRQKRLQEELTVMRPVKVSRLADYREELVRVTTWSTIRVRHNTYSVPSRLIGEWVKVRLYDERLEVYLGGECQMQVERLLGHHGHRINYRHVIWSLVQKPGAFERYRYREEMYPSLAFRRAHDALAEGAGRRADVEYLRVLHMAASISEEAVEATLLQLLDAGSLPSSEKVKELVSPRKVSVPSLSLPPVDLESYDALLEVSEEVLG